MSEEYEPLNPEDIGLLVNIAGPVYQESKYIDSMTGQRPQDSRGAITSGTDQIRVGLERIVQKAVHQPQPSPVYREPEFPLYNPIPPDTGPSPYRERADALRSPGVPLAGVPDYYPASPQLEFDFNLTEQKKTNELLEKNNKLLQKLIGLIQSQKLDEPIKLNTPVKGHNQVPVKSV